MLLWGHVYTFVCLIVGKRRAWDRFFENKKEIWTIGSIDILDMLLFNNVSKFSLSLSRAMQSSGVWKADHRTMPTKTSPSAVISFLALSIILSIWLFQTRSPQSLSGPTLLDLVDHDLSTILQKAAKKHSYIKCKASKLRTFNQSDYIDASDLLEDIKSFPRTPGLVKGNEFLELFLQDAPCWGMSNCCETTAYIRPKNKPDLETFHHIFQEHEFRLLYTIFANSTPKYILDAGSGQGLSTRMLKLIFPNSVTVSLESDGKSFESLEMNSKMYVNMCINPKKP